MEFRDMQEQDTFHAGREYEREIQAKEGDILNPCGHRNSERVKALMEFPSSMCPACLQEQIKELEAALKKYGNCLDSCSFRQGLKSNSFKQCDCGFEQALKG